MFCLKPYLGLRIRENTVSACVLVDDEYSMIRLVRLGAYLCPGSANKLRCVGR
jgi:hypothetical protein